jgi:sulfur relay (sulfurtransferase) complex TusBCD TusD component (DsrE family)
MTLLRSLLLAAALIASAMAIPARAGDADPLFVNMTTSEPHRASMAIQFGRNQLDRGHPLTIFLNDQGVFVGARANAAKYAQQQKLLADAMTKGAKVIACAMCMKHYGVEEVDLLPGIQIGKPELTGAALFGKDTRTLSW